MFNLLALSTILRLVFFNQSLWLDESIQMLALQGHFGPLLSYSLSDFQPPLYHFILKLWTTFAGYSEISLRLPSLLSGLFTVYFVAKIGEFIGNRRLGTIAGFLAATNPLLIYYSQEGRTYAMTTFLVTASFYYFIKILKNKSDLPSTIYYLLSTVLFLWTSYLSWFVLLSQGLYAIYHKRYDLFKIQLLAAATLLFWLPSFFHSLKIGMGDAQLIPGWGKVVGGPSFKALALTWVKANIGRISFANRWLYGSLVLILASLHLYVLRQSRPSAINHRPLLLWILVPIVLGSLVSLWIPAYSYTRILFVVPAYILLLALGLSSLPRLYSVTVLLLNIVFLTIFWFSPQFHREDWRSLVSYLNTQSGTVVLPSLKQNAPLIYYNLRLPLHSSTDLRLSGSTIYYIRYVEEVFDPARLGPTNLNQLGYTITSQQTYSGLQLDVYENSD